MEDDERLVGRVRAGDREAFRELVARYERLVRHVVHRMVTDDGEAEEVCQDVFLRAYRGLAGFRGDAKLSTWIGRIAYNTAAKRLARRRTRVEAAPEDAGRRSTAERATPGTQLDDVVRAELRAFVREKVGELAPEQRAAVTLFHLEEMSVAEVAAVMGVPEGTVKSHLFRARRLLRSMVEERIRGEGDG